MTRTKGEMETKWRGEERRGEERRPGARCRLPPLVSAVASRMSDVHQRTGAPHTSFPLLPLFPLSLEKSPRSPRLCANSCRTTHTELLQPRAADSCVVSSRRRNSTCAHNNKSCSTKPRFSLMEDKGDTLLKALYGASCIVECYIMFTVRLIMALVAGLVSRDGVED